MREGLSLTQKNKAPTEIGMPIFDKKMHRVPGMQWVVDQSASHEDNTVNVLGQELLAKKGVFSPEFCVGSEFFTNTLLEKIKPGTHMLEIGPGTGITSVLAAQKGAEVKAVDINPLAVENTLENARRLRVEDKVKVFLGDIYDPLAEDEKFQVIYWNVPFGFADPDAELSTIQKAVFDPGYKSLQRFISEAHEHLAPGGKVYIGFSSTLGDASSIQKFADQNGFDVKIAKSFDYTETRGGDKPLVITYELFELSPQTIN